MSRRSIVVFLCCLLSLIVSTSLLALAQTPDKQAPAATSAEKTPAATIETKPAVAEVPKTPAPLAPIITSKEAYEMWQKDPEKIKILDCRSPEEFAVVGHAPMAYNIPNMFMTYRWNPKKNDYLWKENPRFIKEVKKTFKPTDTIVVMCRSGNRSPKAVEKMVKAGYKNLYEIREGFEGGKVKDKNDPNYGKRAKNGWRLAGLPWTYALDTNLIYLPEGKPKEK